MGWCSLRRARLWAGVPEGEPGHGLVFIKESQAVGWCSLRRAWLWAGVP